MRIDIKKQLIAQAKAHRDMNDPLSIEELASIAEDIQRKNLAGNVMLPIEPNNEINEQDFCEKILINFIGEQGDMATASKNHKALCEYLK